METSTLQKIKNKASELLLKSGQVLDVRNWDNAGMTEIDLHLPHVDMTEWAEVPYIKFKVASFTFRDYTPFGWDADTRTCSLLIDTAHEGPGAKWASSLNPGEQIHYIGVSSARQSPHPTDLVVALGDASSLAHVLALQQLTLPVSRFDGAVLLTKPEQQGLFSQYFRSPLIPLSNEADLSNWLQTQEYCTSHTRFYLTGNHHLVGRLRRLLKGIGNVHVQAKGFWS